MLSKVNMSIVVDLLIQVILIMFVVSVIERVKSLFRKNSTISILVLHLTCYSVRLMI